MSEPFVAEIRIFAGNFAPRSWAFCDGQLLPVSQNTALFSLVGTTYGGDGRTNFALPNLQGRAPMHPGRGPGLTSRRLGESGGIEAVALSENQIPNHSHPLTVSEDSGNTGNPSQAVLAGTPSHPIYGAPDNLTQTGSAIEGRGGNQPHNNMAPYLTLNFIIALSGLYPSRT